MPSPTESELDLLIAAEIKHDSFYETIGALARHAPIRSVLEIGSSSGEGSTEAWVKGLRDNPLKPKLFCMEVSKVRHDALQKRWGGEGFVTCYHGSSVGPEQFPSDAQVERFWREVESPLRRYPVEQVLGWLEQDRQYLKREGITEGCIGRIKLENGISNFDAVLIDGSEFTGEAELREVYGAEFLLLDDACTYKNHANRARLLADPGYELVKEDLSLRNGYAVFRRRRITPFDPLPAGAPVNFFTIVLNGEPFIRHHIEVMKQFPFPWRWHIVEGPADLKNDTSWSVSAGGELGDEFHQGGRSRDGTSEYLDQLAAEHPGKVLIYRKDAGALWQGKGEMVSAPLASIFEDCLLWQLDSDELWTVEQVVNTRLQFLANPERTAAWFWCWFFLGPRHVVSSRLCYSQNPSQEWLRVWRFRPGMKWASHEPPVLLERMFDGSWRDVAKINPLLHQDTARAGLVFQHFAYVTDAQISFKERYYGYGGLGEAVRKLRSDSGLPCKLSTYFPWVTDATIVNSATACGVIPLATMNEESKTWTFAPNSPIRTAEETEEDQQVVVLDGVFFQLHDTGIARVWHEILKTWSRTGYGKRLVVLDRDGTAPRFPGISYRPVSAFRYERTAEDSFMLQSACDVIGARLFISTYYTAPTRTPSLLLVHDMIAELAGAEHTSPVWQEKELAILHASHHLAVSENTRRDLVRLHPWLEGEEIDIAYNGVSDSFKPAAAAEVDAFRARMDLGNPYILIVGERVGLQGYKNASTVFKAVDFLPRDRRRDFMIVCAGGKPELEAELAVLAGDTAVRLVRFSDEDLRLAYAGAHVLAYPSLYEGFGMPVVEAMACGCPVITCPRGSLQEVGGTAAIYVEPWDFEAVARAVLSLEDPERRARMVREGLSQAAKFSFEKMTGIMERAIARTIELTRGRAHRGRELEWESLRQTQLEKQNLILEMREDEKARQKELGQAEKQIEKLKKNLEKVERRLVRSEQDRKPRWKQRLSRWLGKQ